MSTLPSNPTCMTDVPPSARLLVDADRTPGIERITDSPAPTELTSGVSNWIEKVPVVLAPGAGTSIASIGASTAFSISSVSGSTGSSMMSEGSGRRRPSLSAPV